MVTCQNLQMIASSHIHHVCPHGVVNADVMSLLIADFPEVDIMRVRLLAPHVNLNEKLGETLVNRMNKHRVIYSARIELIDSCQLANNDEDDN